VLHSWETGQREYSPPSEKGRTSKASIEKTLSSEHFKEALVSACVVSDADYLLNYMRAADSGECEALVAASVRKYFLSLAPYCPIPDRRYKFLIPVLEGLQGRLDGSGTRVTWFTELIQNARLSTPTQLLVLCIKAPKFIL
jgi:hypothetical protein